MLSNSCSQIWSPQTWSTKETIPDLSLPLPSEFVPVNLTIYPVNENVSYLRLYKYRPSGYFKLHLQRKLLDSQEPKHPHIIHQSSISEIWLKRDNQLKLPELHIEFDLFRYSPTYLPNFFHVFYSWTNSQFCLRTTNFANSHMFCLRLPGRNKFCTMRWIRTFSISFCSYESE